MATANFNQSMLDKFDLPLVVGGVGNDFEARKKEYGEDYSTEDYADDIYWEIDYINSNLDEFNSDLKHFELTTTSGYYDGWQFDIIETDKYNDFDSIQNINDEDADYYYGMSAKEVKDEFKNELEQIREYLNEQVDPPFITKLYRDGIFSNGEAVYKEAK